MTISVYITSFNQKEYLQEAIDSVLAQTLRPSQIVVVDDFSSDGSQELIKGYHSRYPDLIMPIFHERNLGVARVRVTALQAVTGDYVSYLDGDDRYLSAKLEKESALFASRPDAEIVYSNFYYLSADGQRIGTWITNKKPPQGDVFSETLARRFPDGNLFRMELVPYALWQGTGFHDTSLSVLEDWEMRIRLTSRYHAAYVDEPLAEYRIHTDGLSNAKAAEKLQAFDYIWQKHESLTDGMDTAQRNAIHEDMNRLRAMFLRREAKEVLGAYGGAPRGEKEKAWAYYRESWRYHHYLDWDLLSGLILPANMYRSLRNTMRRYAGKGHGF